MKDLPAAYYRPEQSILGQSSSAWAETFGGRLQLRLLAVGVGLVLQYWTIFNYDYSFFYTTLCYVSHGIFCTIFDVRNLVPYHTMLYKVFSIDSGLDRLRPAAVGLGLRWDRVLEFRV